MDAGPDLTPRKLGKLEPRENAQTFRLARYVDPKLLPPAPAHEKRSPHVTEWPMFGNDRWGDCTCAEVAHHVQLLTAMQGAELIVTLDDVLGAYEKVSGFNPKTGANDNGAVILDVMNLWRHDGVGGHKIGAFASVDIHNHALVKDAVHLFGGLSIGLALPESAQQMGQHWRRPRTLTGGNAPGSWGGHCVFVVDYDRYGVTVITWGELTRVDWAFWNAYCDEAWAPISTDWLTAGHSPDGFTLAALQADLAQVGQVH